MVECINLLSQVVDANYRLFGGASVNQLLSTCHRLHSLSSGNNSPTSSLLFAIPLPLPSSRNFPSSFLLLAATPRPHLVMLPEMDSAAAPDGDGGKAIEPQPDVDDSVISIPSLSVTEARQVAEEEEAVEDAVDDAIDPAQLSAPTKKKRKNKKTTAGRGPLALPKNRGNGFEGMAPPLPQLIQWWLDAKRR